MKKLEVYDPPMCCAPGCDCGKPSENKKAKTVVCLIVARNADVVIRWISGVVLLVAGFYFLFTF